MKPVAAILIMATLVAFMAKALAEEQKLIEEETKPAQPTDAGGMAMWEKIYAVFSHPRCANCHVEDARPRWSGPEFSITRVFSAAGTTMAVLAFAATIVIPNATHRSRTPLPERRSGGLLRRKWHGSASHRRRYVPRSRIPAARMAVD